MKWEKDDHSCLKSFPSLSGSVTHYPAVHVIKLSCALEKLPFPSVAITGNTALRQTAGIQCWHSLVKRSGTSCSLPAACPASWKSDSLWAESSCMHAHHRQWTVYKPRGSWACSEPASLLTVITPQSEQCSFHKRYLIQSTARESQKSTNSENSYWQMWHPAHTPAAEESWCNSPVSPSSFDCLNFVD